MTEEEFMAEWDRWNALTPEEQAQERQEELEESQRKIKEYYEEKARERARRSAEYFKNHDHPNSLENDEATGLWVIVMAIATIFKGNWIIWIIATIVWMRYLNRHQR